MRGGSGWGLLKEGFIDRRKCRTIVLFPSCPAPYIQRSPQCGVPDIAGSFCWYFVRGYSSNVPFPFSYAPEITRFTMVNRLQFYIDGAWVDPVVKKSTPVVNPATEEPMYEIALGSKADVDKAVKAAKRAFDTFSQTSREERVALLSKSRMKEIGAPVSDEMGAPLPMAEKLQAGAGLGHIAATLDVLKNYHFE